VIAETTAPVLSPWAPPRSFELPPVSAVLGPLPEHFVVEEIPAYPLSGQGEHLYLWVEKVGLNTADVAKRLAQVSGIKERDIGFAGMKDKHAVTRQWFSLPCATAPTETWQLGEGARIVSVTRHNNKLRTGHLIGNRFQLTLVDVSPADVVRAQDITERLLKQGFVNSYGGQRFGYQGKNLAQAVRWLKEQTATSTRSDAAEAEQTRGRSRDKRRPNSRFDNKLHPSVIQSEFFNRYAFARLKLQTELLLGEVVRLSGTGTHFVVEDVERELPRKRAGDLLLTGPMPGEKTLKARDQALELEQTVWNEMGWTARDVQALCAQAPGARRDLWTTPEDLRCLHHGDQLLLSFTLPAGGYATEVLRQYNDCDWLNPKGTPAGRP